MAVEFFFFMLKSRVLYGQVQTVRESGLNNSACGEINSNCSDIKDSQRSRNAIVTNSALRTH